jgi:activating signal cointegrator 1
MRGITLLEPWASLMAIGLKRIETRSWATDYRGDLVIHASASKKSCRFSYEVEKLFRDAGVEFPYDWPVKADEYPRGKILGVCRLIDVVEMDAEIINRVPVRERAFGVWKPGRFAWIAPSFRRVEPIPWKGALGLWKVPPELEAKLAA